MGEECARASSGKSYHRGPPVFAGLRKNAAAALHGNPPRVDRIKLPNRGAHDHHDLPWPKTVTDQQRCQSPSPKDMLETTAFGQSVLR